MLDRRRSRLVIAWLPERLLFILALEHFGALIGLDLAENVGEVWDILDHELLVTILLDICNFLLLHGTLSVLVDDLLAVGGEQALLVQLRLRGVMHRVAW